MITKENYITASFIDNDRKTIEVLLSDDKNEKVIPIIIEYNLEHPTCQELLKVVDLDQLHENTHTKIQESQKDFEEMAMRIAKKKGIVFNELKLDTKFYPTLIDAIFKEVENEDHLFALKLALFEVDKIRDSENAELKGAIRKSESKSEAMMYALKIICGK